MRGAVAAHLLAGLRVMEEAAGVARPHRRGRVVTGQPIRAVVEAAREMCERATPEEIDQVIAVMA